MTERRSATTSTTLAGAAALVAVLGATLAVALAASGGDDATRRQAIYLAAAVAGGGALSGWFVSCWTRGRAAGVATAGGLSATLLRLGPMLAALAWISSQEGGLRSAGAAEFLVAFYLPLLATDIVLTLLVGPRGRRNGGANGVN